MLPPSSRWNVTVEVCVDTEQRVQDGEGSRLGQYRLVYSLTSSWKSLFNLMKIEDGSCKDKWLTPFKFDVPFHCPFLGPPLQLCFFSLIIPSAPGKGHVSSLLPISPAEMTTLTLLVLLVVTIFHHCFVLAQLWPCPLIYSLFYIFVHIKSHSFHPVPF